MKKIVTSFYRCKKSVLCLLQYYKINITFQVLISDMWYNTPWSKIMQIVSIISLRYTYIWCYQRKGIILQNKNRRLWSDATHTAIFVAHGQLKKHLWSSLCSANKKCYHKNVKTADLGGHCLFNNKVHFADDVTHIGCYFI